MATIQKFYFHDAGTSDTGTLPATGTSQSLTAPNFTDATAGTNRSMDGVAGSAQAATTIAISGTGAANHDWHRRFLSAPLAAQTIGVGTWTVAIGGLNTNANAGSQLVPGCVYVWRPSNGTLVGGIVDDETTLSATFFNTTEFGIVMTFTGASVVCLAGDILVAEVWTLEDNSLGGAATEKVHYDGTTDPLDNVATTNAASYLNAPAALTMQAAGGGSPNNSGLWGPFARGVPGVTTPQLIYTDPTSGLQAMPWMGLTAYDPDGPTARLFIKWGTDVPPPPPPLVAPMSVPRGLRPEWIRPSYYHVPSQDARPLAFPAFHQPVVQPLPAQRFSAQLFLAPKQAGDPLPVLAFSPYVIQKPEPFWPPPGTFRAPEQAGDPLRFPAFHQPVIQKLRPDWIPPSRYREPTQDARPLPFPAFHGEKLYGAPGVQAPTIFQLLVQVQAAPLIVLPLFMVPYLAIPGAPRPKSFLAPEQAGDPLSSPAFFSALQKLSPQQLPPALFLAPAQAGDPLEFPALFRALQKLTPAWPLPSAYLTPSQAGDPLPFPAFLQALQKLSPNVSAPLFIVIAPTQAEPLFFFNVATPPYSFRVPVTPPSALFLAPEQAGDPLPFPAFLQALQKLSPQQLPPALFLAPAQAGDPLLFFNVATPRYSFQIPPWVPPSFAIAPLLIVIPSTSTPNTVWWLKTPFNPF
jgi:hypothetical protein